ncbi:hypothetical protein EE612_032591 [Oryza sativa]|nr:hypothetical protein EE612_032591 [Oryza sativa]
MRALQQELPHGPSPNYRGAILHAPVLVRLHQDLQDFVVIVKFLRLHLYSSVVGTSSSLTACLHLLPHVLLV